MKKIKELIALAIAICGVSIFAVCWGNTYSRFTSDQLDNVSLSGEKDSDYLTLKKDIVKRKKLLISDINLLSRPLNDAQTSFSHELRFRIAYPSLQEKDYLKDTTIELTDADGDVVKSGAVLLYTVGLSPSKVAKDELTGSYNWIEKNSVEVHYLLEEDFLETYSGQELTVTSCCTENADDPLNTKESYAYAVFKIRIP